MGWAEVGKSIERDVDRVLVVAGGVATLALALVMDVLVRRRRP